jgi:hypothetical protein
MIDLTSYASIQSNLFVRLQIDEYRTTPTGPFTTTVLRVSDRRGNTTINGEVYQGVGALMEVTNSASELRATGGELTIALSGIPNTSIAEIVNSKIKGSTVRIYRGLFNATTGAFLSIAGNPVGRFNGYVNNYSLNEDYDIESRTSSNTLVLTCTSVVTVLENKVSGRKTNPASEKKFYPNDLSMDRVPNLEKATFNFGAPQ